MSIYNVNVNGTENILKLSKKYGFKVVYASSSSVYGNPIKIPIKESDEKNPINPYAETKLKTGRNWQLRYSKVGVKCDRITLFQRIWKGAIERICRSLKIIF